MGPSSSGSSPSVSQSLPLWGERAGASLEPVHFSPWLPPIPALRALNTLNTYAPSLGKNLALYLFVYNNASSTQGHVIDSFSFAVVTFMSVPFGTVLVPGC